SAHAYVQRRGEGDLPGPCRPQPLRVGDPECGEPPPRRADEWRVRTSSPLRSRPYRDGMDGLMQPRPLTIAHILERVERLFAHKEVVTAGVERRTYAEVVGHTRRLATALDLLGV